MRQFFILFWAVFIFSQTLIAAEIEDPKELSGITLDGKNFDLKNLRGKIVIVNFWAQWCLNCVHEMEVLQELYLAHHNQGLEIIGVSIDAKRFVKDVLRRTAKVTYPNALLSDLTANNFPEANALPSSYVIGRGGEITVLKGDHARADFEELLR